MLLSDRDIKAEIAAGRVKLDPYAPELIQPASIDVRIDRYFRVFENHRYPHIDPATEQPELTRLVQPEGDEAFVLHPGEFVLGSTYEVVTLPDDLAGRLEGKALAADTPVATPAGWQTMGTLRPGDEVFDEAGRPTAVVAATKIMLNRPCAQVDFSDGTTVTADLTHRWHTVTKSERRNGRPGGIRTTQEIAKSLRAGDEWNHHIPLAGPVQYPERPLPADPYALGARLGTYLSGSARPGGTAPAACTLPSAGTGAAACAPTAAVGAAGSAVPEVYLRGSVRQRVSLLNGLMDAAGCGRSQGRWALQTPDEQLADAVAELAASLGLRAVTRKMRAAVHGVEQAPMFRVSFDNQIPGGERGLYRAIVAVRETESVPVRCIQVASASGLFLAGRRFVPTHNSSLGRLGLLTHSTAGWIDPGFSGHVTLELSNVATLPIKLWPGMKIGQLCLFRTSSPAEHPYGSAVYASRYQDQRGPTPSRSYLNFYRTDV